MEGLHRIQDDLEKVIEKDDTGSVITSGSDCEEDTLRHGPLTLRQKLDIIIHSSKFQVGVVVLVVFDVLLVLAELLFDLEIVTLREEHRESVPHALHYCSIAILSLFLIEIALRIFVMRLQFFKHKMEVFDAVIVVVSFVLDIVFRNSSDAASGVGLLVILRLWRVTRILNGIVLSVKRQAEKRVEREQQAREACEQELNKFRLHCSSLEAEVEYLYRLLREHNIPFTQKVHKPLSATAASQKISVEVELNHNTTPPPMTTITTTTTTAASSPSSSSAAAAETSSSSMAATTTTPTTTSATPATVKAAQEEMEKVREEKEEEEEGGFKEISERTVEEK